MDSVWEVLSHGEDEPAEEEKQGRDRRKDDEDDS